MDMELLPKTIKGTYTLVEKSEPILTNSSVVGKYKNETPAGPPAYFAIKFPMIRIDGELNFVFRNEQAEEQSIVIKRFERECDLLVLNAARSREEAVIVSAGELTHPDEPNLKRPYLVSRWIEGTDLGLWAKMEPCWSDKCKVIEGLTKALAELHRDDTIHSDLKFNQVLVDSQLQVTLLDLGQSKNLNRPDTYHTQVATEAFKARPDVSTSQRIAVNLPDSVDGFTSPELYLPSPQYTKAMDVYALGVLMYFVFADYATQPLDKLKTRLNDPLRTRGFLNVQELGPLSEYAPNLDPRLHDLIQRCLELDASKRPHDAVIVLKAFRAVTSAPPPPVTKPPGNFSLLAVGFYSLIILLGLLFIIYILNQKL